MTAPRHTLGVPMPSDAAGADYSPTHKTPASLESMPLEWIDASPLNPRRSFDPEKLQELADSIRTHGLLEALVVREVFLDNAETPRFLIIAGERRYRAAILAGLESVPVRVLHGIDEKTHIALALVENLQRQDLDPLEEAAGYKSLSDIGYTQSAIAAAVHRSQPAIAKAVALLNLPEDVQGLIRDGQLSPTHGQIIATHYRGFPAVAEAVARVAVERNLTTHRLEQGIPETYALQQAGVLVEVGYDTLFDVQTCAERCPFSAYRPNGSSRGYCLLPAHYAELQAAAKRVEETKIAAAKKEAKAAGKNVPKLSTLPYDSYEQWRWSVGGDPDAIALLCPLLARAHGPGRAQGRLFCRGGGDQCLSIRTLWLFGSRSTRQARSRRTWRSTTTRRRPVSAGPRLMMPAKAC